MENLSELFIKGFDMSVISLDIMEGKTEFNSIVDLWISKDFPFHGLPLTYYNKLIPIDAFSTINKDNILNNINDLLCLLFPSMAMHKACPKQYSNPEHKKIIAAHILSEHFKYE